jgi:imidazolonepropionase-like amidohydrolase
LSEAGRSASDPNGRPPARRCAQASSQRNPYPGELGVIEADAYVDLLPIDGDPVADIHLVPDPERNLKLIMKDGRVKS